MSKKVFDGLTPDQQKIIMEVAKQTQDKQRASWKDSESKAIEELKQKGVIFNDIADVTPFMEKVKPVWKTYTDKYGTKLVDMIQNTK